LVRAAIGLLTWLEERAAWLVRAAIGLLALFFVAPAEILYGCVLLLCISLALRHSLFCWRHWVDRDVVSCVDWFLVEASNLSFLGVIVGVGRWVLLVSTADDKVGVHILNAVQTACYGRKCTFSTFANNVALSRRSSTCQES